jgi:hypothetical protein
VNDPLFMCRFQRFGDLACDRQRFVQGNRTLRNPVSQRRAFDQLQGQRLHAGRFFKAVDATDVWMVQRGEHLGFALKAGEAIRIRREGLGQNLQRDVAIELRVAGAIHLSHPARPKERDDLVGAETGARRKGHGMSARVDRSYPHFAGGADPSDLDFVKKCVQTTGRRLPAGCGGYRAVTAGSGTLPLAGCDLLPLRSDAGFTVLSSAPVIYMFVDTQATHLFRRHVRNRAENDALARHARSDRWELRQVGAGDGAGRQLRQAEVEHLRVAVCGDRDARGLQIAVDDPFRMRCFQRFSDLMCDRQCFVDRDGSLGDAIGQRRSFDQLQYERLNAVRFVEAVDRRDVRMIEGRENLRFTLEAGKPVEGKGLGEDLQGDVASQLRIAGTIDFAL